MEISAADVKKLRDRTNAPMMECKTALTEANGDMDKAVEIIRKKGKAQADKRADRETAEGRIGIFVDQARKLGAIVEVRCESPPVAKSEQFIALANELAQIVAEDNADTVEKLTAHPKAAARLTETIGLIRENMKPARVARLNGLCGAYVHHDGATGVLLLVEGEKADAQMLRDVCMHITAKNPMAARREDIPADKIAKETEIAKAQVAADPKNALKPANILDKIIDGKVKTWLAENILVDQPFVRDETKTVGALLQSAGLKLVKFIRYRVGELS
jgi:elongation factor Ts